MGPPLIPKIPEPLWGEAGNFPRLPDITADLEADPSSWDIAGFDVSPGDLVILHPHSIHAGGKNDDTLTVRRNLVFVFLATSPTTVITCRTRRACMTTSHCLRQEADFCGTAIPIDQLQ